MSRGTVFVALLGCAAILAGCGNEPPTPGEVAVSSMPAGAAVLLDGRDTGRVTPAVIADLDGGMYRVGVSRDGVTYRPAQKDVEVAYGRRTAVHFETGAGILAVTSEPAGAAIILDGAPTASTTPHTFPEIDPGPHTVDLVLAHHRNVTGPQTVTIEAGVESEVRFDIALSTVVLYEGFSNVSCGGCPAMLANIEYLRTDGGFGPDRFLFIKYAGSFPNGADPLWLSNPQMVRDRTQDYTGGTTWGALPTLYTRGALAGGVGTPPTADALLADVAAGFQDPVDFYLTVDAPDAGDLAVREVACDITIHAPYDPVDLSGRELRAVLLYSEVHTAIEYNPGGSEYHWVARADGVVADLGTIDAGDEITVPITLTDPDPDTFNLTALGREVVVFVQDQTDQFILQAGSTIPADAGPEGSGGAR